MSDDESEEEVNPLIDLWPDFEPIGIDDLPTSRLRDVAESLSTKKMSVINLDACLPKGDDCVSVLQTILFMLTESVKTLSLRFNMLTPEASQLLVDWASVNDTVEIVYLNMSNMSDKTRDAFEANWKKKLSSQRTDNQGWTFIRVVEVPEVDEEEG
jgi:hypothetical protein